MRRCPTTQSLAARLRDRLIRHRLRLDTVVVAHHYRSCVIVVALHHPGEGVDVGKGYGVGCHDPGVENGLCAALDHLRPALEARCQRRRSVVSGSP
jgi:hypothetical protein